MDKNTIYTEKCICCNGSGKCQEFNKEINKWVKSDLQCEECKGTGERQYIDITQPTDFVYRRMYVQS